MVYQPEDDERRVKQLKSQPGLRPNLCSTEVSGYGHPDPSGSSQGGDHILPGGTTGPASRPTRGIRRPEAVVPARHNPAS